MKILWLICLYLAISLSHGHSRGNFGEFKRSLNTKDYGYRLINDPTHIAPHSLIEVFEVRSGDCSHHKNWNDCLTDRERSELSQVNKDTVEGDQYWYGWYIYFPDDFINLSPAKVSLGQFHQYQSYPAWMFQHTSQGFYLVNQLAANKNHELIPEVSLRGRWHKLEIQVAWQTNEQGEFNVWINGKQKVKYRGPTMDAKRVYFKYGLYRAFISRYQRPNNAEINIPIFTPTQKVYFSNVKRANHRSNLAY